MSSAKTVNPVKCELFYTTSIVPPTNYNKAFRVSVDYALKYPPSLFRMRLNKDFWRISGPYEPDWTKNICDLFLKQAITDFKLTPEQIEHFQNTISKKPNHLVIATPTILFAGTLILTSHAPCTISVTSDGVFDFYTSDKTPKISWLNWPNTDGGICWGRAGSEIGKIIPSDIDIKTKLGNLSRTKVRKVITDFLTQRAELYFSTPFNNELYIYSPDKASVRYISHPLCEAVAAYCPDWQKIYKKLYEKNGKHIAKINGKLETLLSTKPIKIRMINE